MLNFCQWCKTPSSAFSKKFQRRPPIFCTFSAEPQLIYNYALYNWKLSHRVRDIRLLSIPWTWNPGFTGHPRSSKIIPVDPAPKAYINVPYSNHRPISHRFQDRRQYIRRKLPIFPPPCIKRPRWRGSPWNLVSAQGVPNVSMMGLPDGRKSFKI